MMEDKALQWKGQIAECCLKKAEPFLLCLHYRNVNLFEDAEKDGV